MIKLEFIYLEGLIATAAQCCKSAKENDLQEEKSFLGDDDPPAELHSPTTLLMTTARANVVLLVLELVTLLAMPPPLPLSGELLALSQLRLEASRFLRFLMYAFSGFAMSFMEDDTSPRLAKDFDLPL